MRYITTIILLALLAVTAGCSSTKQGAIYSPVPEVVVGAGGNEGRLLDTLVDRTGGGYLIGASKAHILNQDQSAARQAIEDAQAIPATLKQARLATTADLNGNGFITLDELVAMRNAGLTDGQMLERLRASDQIFEPTDVQRQYLRDSGVSESVVSGMAEINREERAEIRFRTLGVHRPPPPAPLPPPPPE